MKEKANPKKKLSRWDEKVSRKHQESKEDQKKVGQKITCKMEKKRTGWAPNTGVGVRGMEDFGTLQELCNERSTFCMGP